MKDSHALMREALSYKPRACFVGFSGGDDSLAVAHWTITNYPFFKAFHANTGIGIERTREFVRWTCKKYGWELVEIRAEEDCGQDYDQMVLQYGFPGPAMHCKMYSRLKERAVEKLVRDHKQHRMDKIAIVTGIRRDESKRRMGYVDREIDFKGAQMWVNPHYWSTKAQFMDYIREQKLERNPVAEMLGMSGECLCGAFAHSGEKVLIRIVDPATADRIEALEARVRAAGHNWGWEEGPPKKSKQKPPEAFMPFCTGCEKHG
jgi:3'-phosphoadenosine 5'-phosphosulfate sulfotransferase (PAPS reductase)/FAD synthetase